MLDLNADSTIVSECINFSKRANNKLQSYQAEAQPQLTHIQVTEEQPEQSKEDEATKFVASEKEEQSIE
jgi:hypothetical protein